MTALDIIKIIWPLVLIQVGFQVYALVDLFKINKGKTKNLSTTIWAIIIVLGEIVGPVLYFVAGRKEQ